MLGLSCLTYSQESCQGCMWQQHSAVRKVPHRSQPWNSAVWPSARPSPSPALSSFSDKMRESGKPWPPSSNQAQALLAPGSLPWWTPPASEGHFSSHGFRCSSLKWWSRFACMFLSGFPASPQQCLGVRVTKSSSPTCPSIPSRESHSFAIKWASGNSQTDPACTEHFLCPI